MRCGMSANETVVQQILGNKQSNFVHPFYMIFSEINYSEDYINVIKSNIKLAFVLYARL